MAIEWKAGFQAKRVPGTEPDGRRSPGHESVPQHRAVFLPGEELET
ncbi:unnamed protein product, partial [marine sediment metagenome]